MSWRVTIRPRAEADLQQAWQWYQREQPGLGDEFLLEMQRLVGSLEHRPERAPVYYRGFRNLLGVRFPYKLFYRVTGDQVIVFRFLHAKRDHPRWLNR